MAFRKILFIGMPGAGKGTQAELLEKYGFKHISTGDLIRDAFNREDPIIMPYKKDIESGRFLPDKLIFDLIESSTKGLEGYKGYILDGAIRNTAQANLAIKRKLIDEAVFFDLPKRKAVQRLAGRLVCPECKKIYVSGAGLCSECGVPLVKRKDDHPVAIRERFEIYREKTKPILDLLKNNIKKYHVIDASVTIPEINTKVLETLNINIK
jgi:adenylate kinase